MPGVSPDYPAPVVRNGDRGTELVAMRWGMPPPPRTGRSARDEHPEYVFTALAHVAEARNRCLVPANRFAEYAPEPNPETKKKDVA